MKATDRIVMKLAEETISSELMVALNEDAKAVLPSDAYQIGWGAAVMAFQKALADVPDIPREPTKSMIDSAGPAIDKYYAGTKGAPFEGSVRAAWQAMWDAAKEKAPEDA